MITDQEILFSHWILVFRKMEHTSFTRWLHFTKKKKTHLTKKKKDPQPWIVLFFLLCLL
jgi:polyphosphate kinase 2 (PPK2 family)